jgi:hypothetical protein
MGPVLGPPGTEVILGMQEQFQVQRGDGGGEMSRR